MKQRVLPVEDDASLARSVIEGLSDEGFAVSHAADGHAARKALRAGGWDNLPRGQSSSLIDLPRSGTSRRRRGPAGGGR